MCPSEGCTVRIHKYCLKKLLSQRVYTAYLVFLQPQWNLSLISIVFYSLITSKLQDDKRCSGCGKPWPLGKATKAEAAEEAMNNEEENETQAAAPKSKRRRQLRSHGDSTDNGSSQASLASTSGTTGRRVTRSATQSR